MKFAGNMSGRLEGQVAIITGGTSGIGKRMPEIFVEEGASVVIAARRETQGQEIADALGEKAAFIQTDVAKEDDIKATIQFINSHNLVVDGGVMGGRPWTAQQEGRARLHQTLVQHAQ